MISTSWSIPDSPGKSGCPSISSAITQPVDHTSGRLISLLAPNSMGERKRARTDLRCVVGRAKDQLGRPVVARANVGDIGLVFDQNLGGAEITQFEDAGVGVQQKVLRFNVTVTDSLRVDVGKRSEQLVDVEFDLQHGHCGLQFVEIARCAVHRLWDIFEDEVEIHFIFLWGHEDSWSVTGN